MIILCLLNSLAYYYTQPNQRAGLITYALVGKLAMRAEKRESTCFSQQQYHNCLTKWLCVLNAVLYELVEKSTTKFFDGHNQIKKVKNVKRSF